MRIFNILLNHKTNCTNDKVWGVEQCFVDYSKYLPSYDNELFSITTKGTNYQSRAAKFSKSSLAISSASLFNLLTFVKIILFFVMHRPDAIICHSGRAFKFAYIARFFLFKKIPIIGIDHGINPNKFLKADFVLAVNSYFRKKIIEKGKAEDRCFAIKNTISIPESYIAPIKTSVHDNFIQRKRIRIGSLARLYYEKGFDRVIKAISLLSERGIDCEFAIGGLGNEEDKLKKLAKDLNVEDRFSLIGWVSDKKTFFEQIDIFILPSRYETFGIVLLEAMLYMTPIITANSWGPNDIIEDGVNGLKISNDNEDETPELIAKAIEKLVTTPGLSTQISNQANIDLYQKYTPEKVIFEINEICKIAIKQMQ